MPSPFPGMDAYLEAQRHWEIFHGWFIHKLAELALPTAASMGCWIDVERDVYGEDPSGATVLIGEADEVLTVASTESTWSGHVGGAATLAVPRSIRVAGRRAAAVGRSARLAASAPSKLNFRAALAVHYGSPAAGMPVNAPRFSVDGALDLAAAFRSAYDLTTGGRPIDYKTETVPEPALMPEDATWTANLLTPIR